MCGLFMTPQNCYSWAIGLSDWVLHSVMKLGHQAGNDGCEYLSDGRVWCGGGSQGQYNQHRDHIEIYDGVDWAVSAHTLPIKMIFHHATEIEPGVLLLSGGYAAWDTINADVSLCESERQCWCSQSHQTSLLTTQSFPPPHSLLHTLPSSFHLPKRPFLLFAVNVHLFSTFSLAYSPPVLTTIFQLQNLGPFELFKTKYSSRSFSLAPLNKYRPI